jgi:hypothetical protein
METNPYLSLSLETLLAYANRKRKAYSQMTAVTSNCDTFRDNLQLNSDQTGSTLVFVAKEVAGRNSQGRSQ